MMNLIEQYEAAVEAVRNYDAQTNDIVRERAAGRIPLVQRQHEAGIAALTNTIARIGDTQQEPEQTSE